MKQISKHFVWLIEQVAEQVIEHDTRVITPVMFKGQCHVDEPMQMQQNNIDRVIKLDKFIISTQSSCNNSLISDM